MRTYKRMADRINQARMIVEGASKPEPAQALSAFGYPEQNLLEGQGYQQAAEQAYLRVQQQQGKLTRVRQQLQQMSRQAYEHYIDHLALARQAFPESSEARQRLGIRGQRRPDETGWLQQAVDFYQSAREEEIEPIFTRQGVNLAEARAELNEVLRLRGEIKRMRGEARQARLERDAAFARVERWLKVFAATARLAFRRSRSLLEQLGL